MGNQTLNHHSIYSARQAITKYICGHFNRTIRSEYLFQHYWESINKVQEFAAQWIYKNNHQHLNMALGGIVPKQCLAMVTKGKLLQGSVK